MDQQVTTQESGSSPGPRLSAATPDGLARAEALRATRTETPALPSVSYRSAGRLLIIGGEDQALSAADVLKRRVRCTVLVTGEPRQRPENPRDDGDVVTVHGKLLELTGHLGEFRARVATSREKVDLASFAGTGQDHFDLVLDLSSPAFIRREVPPPGYYAPGTNDKKRRRAFSDIPEMVGEFEKPRYFEYNPDICAHGVNGLKGCTRCIDACPTLAIRSVGDKIAVDPYLCQGAGSCATACPTGAITYAYPPARNLLDDVRAVLKTYRDSGGRGSCLLFHDRERGLSTVAGAAERLPENVIPLAVEEIGSVGMDVWLAALAYGAGRAVLLAAPAAPASMLRELHGQLEYAAVIMEGMGYSRGRLQLILADDADGLLAALDARATVAEFTPANFSAMQEKRTTIRLAVDHLHAYAPRAKRTVSLPVGAPFGEIKVDRHACTLCMACVSTCPASALSDGADLPQLIFREANCVQCGLCETACPEDAITRAPRFVYDQELRKQARILNEQQPFCCVGCGKPFATQAMMDRMTEKLKGHWMFQAPDALRRLQMCEDCRVKEMFRSNGGLVDVHRRP